VPIFLISLPVFETKLFKLFISFFKVFGIFDKEPIGSLMASLAFLLVSSTVLTTLKRTVNIAVVITLKINTITNNINSINNTINLYGNTINIGSTNSIININGTTTYIATVNLKIKDKYITLNIDPNTNLPFDNGNLCGFEILGISGNGFIKTNNDATRYILKAPLNSDIFYISITDINNNLYISGNSLFYGDSTYNSSLYISNNAIIENNMSLNSNLYVNNNSFVNNSLSSLSSLYVSGNTIFNNDTTINSVLNVLYDTNINNNCSVLNNLYVSNSSIINGSNTINASLYVSGTTFFNNNLTINSTLYVNNNTIINNNLTCNNNLYISGFTLLNNNTTINSSLNVSGSTFINGNTTILSSLNISGNSYIVGNTTIGSNTNNIFNISGNIISALPNYDNNLLATSNGVPLYGFYRTGGIVKIRLDNNPPILQLVGPSVDTVSYNNIYNDPGIIATDDNDGLVMPYLTSISDGTNNYLTSNISVSGTTPITITSTLAIGTYTLYYMAMDITGNEGYITRTLLIN